MSVMSAPELDVMSSKKRKRDEEQPLILRQPKPRAPAVFKPVPTSRVIDPPTPFSLRRRAEAAKPSPTVDEAVQSPRSESPGSASAERPEPPLDADEDEAREPFAPPDEEDDAPQPFAPPLYDGEEEEYDDEEDDEEDYDDEQDAADEFERVAREVLDDPSFGALAAILEGRDAAALEAYLQIAPRELQDAYRRCRAAANAPLAGDAARLDAIDAWREEAERRLAPEAYAAVIDALRDRGLSARALRSDPARGLLAALGVAQPAPIPRAPPQPPAMPPPRPRTSGGRRAVVRNVSGHVPAGATAVLEMRRVGDVTWRRFKTQSEAGKALGIAQSEVSHLVNNRSRAAGKSLMYEARRVVAAPRRRNASGHFVAATRQSPRSRNASAPAAPVACGRSPPPRRSLHGEPTQTAPEDRRFEPLDPSELPVLGAASEDAQALYDEAGTEEPLDDARAKKKADASTYRFDDDDDDDRPRTRRQRDAAGAKKKADASTYQFDDDDDDEDMDEFSGLKTRQLREAMQRRGIPRSSYDTPEDFRRKLRAHKTGESPRRPSSEAAPMPGRPKGYERTGSNPTGERKACEVRRVGGAWRRFASRSDAAVAFKGALSRSDITKLINGDTTPNATIKAKRLQFEARNVDDDGTTSQEVLNVSQPPGRPPKGKRWDTVTGAWVQTQGPKPRAAPGGIREGAVVDAVAEAFGEAFARGRSKVKFRGTVVERGTTDGHDSGRPALSEEEVGGPVWRVRYDDDGLVWATPERFLVVVEKSPLRSNSWTTSEENKLRGLVKDLGNRWTEIGDRLGTGRTPGAVDQHWKLMEGQGESVTVPRRLCDRWTSGEERRLRDTVSAAGHPATRLGAKGWAEITARLGTRRSPSAVERHWQQITEKPGQDRRRRDNDDDEWVEGNKPKKRRGGDARRRQEEADAALARRLQAEEEDEEGPAPVQRQWRRWTPGEERHLRDLFDDLGDDWSAIAEGLGTARSAWAVEQHWILMNRDDGAPPPPPPMPPRQVTAPPAHRLLTLTQAADTVSPIAPDAADAPPRRLALPTQLPPRWAAIVASHGEDADTSWADAMREELSCPICLDAVERAVQVPCGHVFCSDCLAINQSLGESRHDCPSCRTPFRSRGVTVADVARDTIRMLQRYVVPGAAAAPVPTSPTSPTSYSDDAEDFEDDEIPDDGDEDVMEYDDGTA